MQCVCLPRVAVNTSFGQQSAGCERYCASVFPSGSSLLDGCVESCSWDFADAPDCGLACESQGLAGEALEACRLACLFHATCGPCTQPFCVPDANGVPECLSELPGMAGPTTSHHSRDTGAFIGVLLAGGLLLMAAIIIVAVLAVRRFRAAREMQEDPERRRHRGDRATYIQVGKAGETLLDTSGSEASSSRAASAMPAATMPYVKVDFPHMASSESDETEERALRTGTMHSMATTAVTYTAIDKKMTTAINKALASSSRHATMLLSAQPQQQPPPPSSSSLQSRESSIRQPSVTPPPSFVPGNLDELLANMSMAEADALLEARCAKLGGTDGLFLLRIEPADEDTPTDTIMLSMITDGITHHYPIAEVDDAFYLGPESFESLEELVEFFCSTDSTLIAGRLSHIIL